MKRASRTISRVFVKKKAPPKSKFNPDGDTIPTIVECCCNFLESRGASFLAPPFSVVFSPPWQRSTQRDYSE
jgi:hypothetical protein